MAPRPYFLLDHALAEIGVGVRWLREQGVERVVLLGNSGGGSLMGAYHSQSVEPNIRPARGRTVVDAALDLPPADLFVFVAAHPGRPEVLTDWMDPSIDRRVRPHVRRSGARPVRPRQRPALRAEFVERYRAAQRARNDRITAWCHAELDRLEAGGLTDRLFTMSRTWADLRMIDGSLDPSDRRTPWCYAGDPQRANDGVFGIGHGEHVPQLAEHVEPHRLRLPRRPAPGAPRPADAPRPAAADNGVFPSQAAELFDAIAAADKQFETVAGDHYFLDRPAPATRSPIWSPTGSPHGREGSMSR